MLRVKNGFAEEEVPFGFRQILMNVRYTTPETAEHPDLTMICEIQLNLVSCALVVGGGGGEESRSLRARGLNDSSASLQRQTVGRTWHGCDSLLFFLRMISVHARRPACTHDVRMPACVCAYTATTTTTTTTTTTSDVNVKHQIHKLYSVARCTANTSHQADLKRQMMKQAMSF